MNKIINKFLLAEDKFILEMDIRKLGFKKRKTYSPIKDNILGADPKYTQFISKYNKRFSFSNVLGLFL